MRISSYILIGGAFAFLIYAVSRRFNIGRLQYILQNAALKSSQLAMLVVVSNPFNRPFTQKNIDANVFLNGKLAGSLQDASMFSIQPNDFTQQAFVLDVDQTSFGDMQLQSVRIAGTVNIDGLENPLDIKLKFI